MPNLRERLANFLLGDEKARLEEATQRLYKAYLEGPYLRSPEELLVELQEVDSALLQDLVDQMGYDVVGSVGYGPSEPSEGARIRAIDESRRLFRYDVVTQWVIWLWTNFGFGQTISVIPEDETALGVWNEFWDADRNQRLLAEDELHSLSEDLLVDGEKFMLLFVSTLDGKVTLREMDTKEVVEIITHPDDKETVMYYKRQWSDGKGNYREMYYPDWLTLITGELDKDYLDIATGKSTSPTGVLPKGAIRADQVNPSTIVCCLHIAHNRKGGIRGWPLMAAGAPWSRAHKKFREDRTAVSSAVAMFVRKVKVKGGSRAVNTMKDRFASTLSYANSTEGNPPPVAGSMWVENDSAELSNLSLGTGAGDAKSDGEALLTMAGIGGGVYPHWIGAGDAYRLATATSMEAPMYREFLRYQKFWGAQFKKMVRIVLWAAEEYGNMSFDTYQADVSTDRLLQTDVDQLVTGLSKAVETLMLPFADSLPEDTQKKILATSWRLILQSLEVSDADLLASEEAFGVGVPSPEPPPVVVGGGGTEVSRPFEEELSAQEFFPGQTLGDAQVEYETALYVAMSGYLESSSPSTAYKNSFNQAVNDAFTVVFASGWVDGQEGTASPMTPEATDVLNSRISQEMVYVDSLFLELGDLRQSPLADALAYAEQRAISYAGTLGSVYDLGKVMGAEGAMLTFEGTDGADSCATCQSLKGVTQPAKWWLDSDLIPGQPGNSNYECGGYKCQHILVDSQGKQFLSEQADHLRRLQWAQALSIREGGPGSGNHGHTGVPGIKGGSAPGGGSGAGLLNLTRGATLTTSVNSAPMQHTTFSSDTIQSEGFNFSSNSMYGRGIYFSDAELSSKYGDSVIEISLSPHTQLEIPRDIDVPKVIGGLGLDYGSADLPSQMVDLGIGSMRFKVDDQIYTVVFNPKLINIKNVRKVSAPGVAAQDGENAP